MMGVTGPNDTWISMPNDARSTDAPPARAWPDVAGLAYGGDYNAEQWSRETWVEDVRLMQEAGVNLVSVGIFSWALLEPREGEFDFGWLDDLIDLLHDGGIKVDLATPTVVPPAWFYATYPDARVITADGVPLGPGSRGMASHSHPAYRAACVRIADALANRYAGHPAVVMWHIHNEYGVPVAEDHSPAAAEAWRDWLKGRYGSLDRLNEAWGTAFWGQVYGEWEHITTPRATATAGNPAQKLDFARFTDDQLRACFLAEKEAIRAHADQPITTNFMAHQSWNVDLWKWAEIVDVVSDDHYLWTADANGHVGLSLAADLTRSVAGGRPWILMEHSTSAVNWQSRNVAKRAGEMRRNSLTHVGRGADAILFFQWRASRSGAEKFHSAMLPHGGTDTRVWREVVELGSELGNLAEVCGSEVVADVAVLYDWESLWAQDLEWRPSEAIGFRDQMRTWYERLWRDHLTVDFVHPEADLSGYRLVVAPSSYLLTRAAAENLTDFVASGGTLLVNYFAAAVDECDRVHDGGYLAPLTLALGVRVDEYLPMREGDLASVTWLADGSTLKNHTWQEALILDGATPMATAVDGPAAGNALVTRHEHGDGSGWYVAAHLDVADLAPIFAAAYRDAGIEPPPWPDGLEVVHRRGEAADYYIAVNHSVSAAPGLDGARTLLRGDSHDAMIEAGSVEVYAVPRTTHQTPPHGDLPATTTSSAP